MMNPTKWLRHNLRRRLSRGYSADSEIALDPCVPEGVLRVAEHGEDFAVRVTAGNGTQYFLSDRRVISRKGDSIEVAFRYCDIAHVHWIMKDPLKHAFKMPNPEQEISNMKRLHGDRLLIELRGTGSLVVMDTLGGAYFPIYEFLRLRDRFDKPRTV